MNKNLKVIEARKEIKAQFPSVTPPSGIAFVGEAGGDEEEFAGKPFVGASGRKLNEMLEAAGIDRDACLVTNVIMRHPPLNDFRYFLTKEKGNDKKYALPGLGWLKPEFYSEFDRLAREITDSGVGVVVALGAKALWALTGETKITKCRGTIMDCQLVPGVKVVPTFHPAYVIRTGGWNEDVINDMLLAVQASKGKVKIPEREIWIEPSLEDIREFRRRYLDDADEYAVDIETEYKVLKQITCIGFAPDDKHAIVIPFTDFRKASGSYWKTVDEELEAWTIVQELLADRSKVKLGQNFMYDMQYLYWNGCMTHGRVDDTMIMAHAISPERPKDLAYLTTTYGSDPTAWKTFVNFDTNKEG